MPSSPLFYLFVKQFDNFNKMTEYCKNHQTVKRLQSCYGPYHGQGEQPKSIDEPNRPEFSWPVKSDFVYQGPYPHRCRAYFLYRVDLLPRPKFDDAQRMSNLNPEEQWNGLRPVRKLSGPILTGSSCSNSMAKVMAKAVCYPGALTKDPPMSRTPLRIDEYHKVSEKILATNDGFCLRHQSTSKSWPNMLADPSIIKGQNKSQADRNALTDGRCLESGPSIESTNVLQLESGNGEKTGDNQQTLDLIRSDLTSKYVFGGLFQAVSTSITHVHVFLILFGRSGKEQRAELAPKFHIGFHPLILFMVSHVITKISRFAHSNGCKEESKGTVLYTLILIFLPCYFLVYPLLPPIKPSTVLETLKQSLKDTTHLYTSHIHVMNDPATFRIAIEEIELSTAGLTRIYLDACQRLSLTDHHSWSHYLSDAKHVLLKAHEYQREIDCLKKRLEMKIIKEEERKIQHSILQQRATRDWDDDNDPFNHRLWYHPCIV
ncbi:uncharacterized protein EV420DRAFT_1485577 [Desarmillaria tabescens]|uniref:Uncharacterized protein n=1 Tax=Armillaria tabescens TaxID=1929756 RepID=A0AA39JEX8_ARMTA|nr:uncharacterized protein EV420DRAFT_1485577 [Desarmillaria tabescens]KAK0441501.1 hypothetical protein EV420DRAFT_1485577 [Desarmillaria tabescens]